MKTNKNKDHKFIQNWTILTMCFMYFANVSYGSFAAKKTGAAWMLYNYCI